MNLGKQKRFNIQIKPKDKPTFQVEIIGFIVKDINLPFTLICHQAHNSFGQLIEGGNYIVSEHKTGVGFPSREQNEYPEDAVQECLGLIEKHSPEKVKEMLSNYEEIN